MEARRARGYIGDKMSIGITHTNTDIMHLVGTLLQQLVSEDYRHAAGMANAIADLIQELHTQELNVRSGKVSA